MVHGKNFWASSFAQPSQYVPGKSTTFPVLAMTLITGHATGAGRLFFFGAISTSTTICEQNFGTTPAGCRRFDPPWRASGARGHWGVRIPGARGACPCVPLALMYSTFLYPPQSGYRGLDWIPGLSDRIGLDTAAVSIRIVSSQSAWRLEEAQMGTERNEEKSTARPRSEAEAS